SCVCNITMITAIDSATNIRSGCNWKCFSERMEPINSEFSARSIVPFRNVMNARFRSLVAAGLCLLPGSLLARLNVVVSTPDLAALAAEVGGTAVNITTLARPTEDPHFVDARPNFVVKLNHADAIVEGGAELEIGWLPPLVEGSRNPKLA